DDAVDRLDAALVVLRERAGGRAEAVLAVDDERGVVGAGLRGLGNAGLHGLDGGEEEHRNRHAEEGQRGADAVAGDLLDDVGGEACDRVHAKASVWDSVSTGGSTGGRADAG